jgi:hypothetical protein
MKWTKQLIAGLKAPKGANALRIETSDGKSSEATVKHAPTSFDGVEGTLTWGAFFGRGKAAKFVPLVNGRVEEPKQPSPLEKAIVATVPVVAAAVVAEGKAEAPDIDITAKTVGKTIVLNVSQPDKAFGPEPGGEPEAPAAKKVARKIDAPTKEKKERKPKEQRGPSACSFIKDLYISRSVTAAEAAAQTVEKFGGELAKRLNTVRGVAAGCNKKGIVGSWLRAVRVGGKSRKLSAAHAVFVAWGRDRKLTSEVKDALDGLLASYAE